MQVGVFAGQRRQGVGGDLRGGFASREGDGQDPLHPRHLEREKRAAVTNGKVAQPHSLADERLAVPVGTQRAGERRRFVAGKRQDVEVPRVRVQRVGIDHRYAGGGIDTADRKVAHRGRAEHPHPIQLPESQLRRLRRRKQGHQLFELLRPRPARPQQRRNRRQRGRREHIDRNGALEQLVGKDVCRRRARAAAGKRDTDFHGRPPQSEILPSPAAKPPHSRDDNVRAPPVGRRTGHYHSMLCDGGCH